jgi:uncharacterized membrane protein
MNLRDTAMVLTVCLVWAFNFIAAAKGVEYFSPQALMVLRFAMVLVVTFPFLRRPTRGHWWPLLGGALCIGALHFTLMFWALQRSTDVTSIVIIQQMYIPIGVMLAIAFLGERAGWKTLASIALATAGIVVIGFDPLVSCAGSTELACWDSRPGPRCLYCRSSACCGGSATPTPWLQSLAPSRSTGRRWPTRPCSHRWWGTVCSSS